MATTKDHKINLTAMLGAMDRRQLDWFDNLDDDQKKEFEPWMAMRFASSVDGSQGIKEHYLLCTNDFVNRNFGAISIKEHKELHWLCLRTVGIGKSVIHPFVKPPKRATKNKLQTWLIEQFPHLSNEEIDLMIAVNSKEAFKDYAKQLNLDPKQIKELF
jgi:hypothetical protein